MSTALLTSVSAFCGHHGIRAPLLRELVVAGRNSRVTRLGNQDGQWILKEYGPLSLGGPDRHDRLGSEFAFLKYLESGSIANVARPIALDRALGCALYSCLPGARPTHITAGHVSQAALFIAAVNRDCMTPQAHALAAAADACRTSHDHLALVRTRLAELTALDPRSMLEVQALALIVDGYVPVWRAIERTSIDSIAADRPNTRILSPSDFGFHNTLLDQGRLSFVDFEYAGWDDPAKLICDFICQPELPVTAAQGSQFIDELTAAMPQFGDLRLRVDALLPAHRLKWCCILLNEFRPDHYRRRVHAGIASEGLLSEQLEKARRYFDEHMGTYMLQATCGKGEQQRLLNEFPEILHHAPAAP